MNSSNYPPSKPFKRKHGQLTCPISFAVSPLAPTWASDREVERHNGEKRMFPAGSFSHSCLNKSTAKAEFASLRASIMGLEPSTKLNFRSKLCSQLHPANSSKDAASGKQWSWAGGKEKLLVTSKREADTKKALGKCLEAQVVFCVCCSPQYPHILLSRWAASGARPRCHFLSRWPEQLPASGKPNLLYNHIF